MIGSTIEVFCDYKRQTPKKIMHCHQTFKVNSNERVITAREFHAYAVKRDWHFTKDGKAYCPRCTEIKIRVDLDRELGPV